MSNSNYELFFWRLSGASSRYKKQIEVTGTNERLGTLYDDIFGSHARTEFTAYTGSLELVDSETRYITEDSINNEFFEKYYLAPEQIKVTGSQSDKSIGYRQFFRRLLEDNDTNSDLTSNIRGSNKVSFLTGTIGDGKSTLLSKVGYDIAQKKDRVLPIYLSIEEDWTQTDRDGSRVPRPLDEEFYSELLLPKIKRVVGNDPRLPEYSFNSSGLTVQNCIAKYLESIRKEGFFVLLVFDDLDRYHFYHDKYALFDSEESRYKSLDQIVDLYKTFSRYDKEKPLSCLGISVVFVLRDYVYSLINEREGLNPRGGKNLCYEISRPNYKEVVDQRFLFLLDAIGVLSNRGEFWKLIKENVLEVKNAISAIRHSEIGRLSDSKNIEQVFLLSHHGCRSIVDFMKGLRMFGSVDRPGVIDRYLAEDHSAVVVLYLLNHRYLYTQNSNHFPNMFLVNSHIVSSNELAEKHPFACVPHRHSYWLKYLILAYVNWSEGRCSASEIISVFCGIGDYEESIVRLAIGSLATPNWFSCLRFEYESANIDINSRSVFLTSRGRYLLSSHHGEEGFLFSFIYLQLVVDDYLLHFPNTVEKYRVINDYRYLYEPSGPYGDGLVKLISEKFPRVIQFIKVLESALVAEKLRDPSLFAYFEEVGMNLPNFEKIYENNREAVQRLLGDSRTRELLGDTKSILHEARGNSEIEKFFTKHYSGEDPVMVGVVGRANSNGI